MSGFLSKKTEGHPQAVKYRLYRGFGTQKPYFRDIDKAIDFSFIYDEVKDLYSDECWTVGWGRLVLLEISLAVGDFAYLAWKSSEKFLMVKKWDWFYGLILYLIFN